MSTGTNANYAAPENGSLLVFNLPGEAISN